MAAIVQLDPLILKTIKSLKSVETISTLKELLSLT